MYTTTKAHPIIRQIKLIIKKDFTTTIFDSKNGALADHQAFISQDIDIYLSYRTQIAFLKADEVLKFFSSKYINFTDIFSKNLAVKISEDTKINDPLSTF